MSSEVYLWSVLCASNVGVPYWQTAQVESVTDPSGGTCTDGSLILQAIQGNLAPNAPTSTVIAPGDTLAYGEIFAYTGTGIKLPAGNAGDVLVSQGSGAELKWTAGSGFGTVMEVDTGTGLTGGPITTSGTISFASAPDKCVLGTSTGAGPPTPIVLSAGDLITNTGTSLVLPGNVTTATQYLSQTGTGVASATPQWATISGGDITGAALTKVDDTNVTLTLGGSPSTALLRATSLTLGWTGTLAATRGGTGFGTYVVGQILYADTISTLAQLAIGSANQILTVSGGLPSWQSAASALGQALTKTDDTNVTLTLGGSPSTALLAATSLTLGWSGTLAATRGGTGYGSYVLGQMLYADTTSTLSRLAIGTSNQILTVSGGLPSWQSAASVLGQALTKTDDTNVTLTLGGSPTTALLAATSLTLGWTGTLAATRGGTGFGTYVLGQILYADTTTTLAKLNGNTTSGIQYLSQTGTGTVSAAPIWATISGGDITGAALTKTDDTNVTLTLGGSPSTALLRATSLTLGWTGTLAATRGGTGYGVYVVGQMLYADTTSTLSRLAIGTSNQILTVSGGLPSWQSAATVLGQALTKTDDTNVTLTLGGSPTTALLAATSLTLGWTGTLAATRGGTGYGSYILGQILYADTVSTLAKLNGNTTTGIQYLSQTGTGTISAAPIWATISGGDITGAALTKTDDTNVTLTLGGSPSTALLRATSLTLGWTGTLAATRGGTGFGVYVVGDILYSDTTSTLAKLGIGSSNQVLTVSGGLPSWQSLSSIGVTSITGTANQVLANNTSGSAQIGAVTLTFQDDAKVVTSLGVGVAPTGVSGQISGTTAILTGTPSVYSTTFSVYDSPGTANRLVYVNSSLTSVGYQAGVSNAGANCTHVGYMAGQRLTSGTQNTCIGSQAGFGASTFTAEDMTAVGYKAGYVITTGTCNTLIGSQAGITLSSGSYNVAVGFQVNYSSTTRANCVAIGAFALYTNNAADSLTAVGHQAGYYVNTASANFTAVGYRAGYSATGVDCTYVGYSAGQWLTTGTQNTCVGSQAGVGASPLTAGDLTAVGYKAGFVITTGNQNTLIGSQAGVTISSGSSNVGVGYQAQKSNTTSNYCVAVGHSALYTNNSGSGLTAVGYEAGYVANTALSHLTALGYQAGRQNTTGVDCTHVGYQAGFGLTSGARNTCVGSQAGYGATTFTAGDLTAVGFKAGYAITTGVYNTLLGSQAGVALTSAIGHVAVGYQAQNANTTFSYSTAIGYQALFTNNAADGLTAVGYQAGYSINAANANFTALGYLAGYAGNGVDCTYVGYLAGQNLTSGTQNTCLGSQAGRGASTFTAGNLTAVGFKAGYAITRGNYNTLMGSQAGVALTTGSSNVAVGYQAQNAAPNVSNNVAVGYQALFSNTLANSQTAVGYQAAYSTNSSSANITAVGYTAGYSMNIANANLTAVGHQAGYLATGVDCTYIGYYAGVLLTSGTQNTCVGSRAGYSNGGTHTAGNLTAVGFKAGYAITTGDANTLIGSSAGVAISSGSSNVAVGYQALNANTTFGSSVAIGYQALYTNNASGTLTAVGYQAGYSMNAVGPNFTAVGYQAGYSATGVDCTYVGYFAGQNLTTGTQNTCVGSLAGRGASTYTAADLTAVGYQAGLSVTTGSSNTLVGSQSGRFITSGGSNAAFGYQALGSNTTFSGLVAVGYAAGFSMNTASANLTAVGFQAGYSATGVDCTYLGYAAGQRLTSGTQNTCVGSQAGYGATTFTAGNLTAVGFKAGYAITTGNQNTLIGSQAGIALTSGGSNVALGFQALFSNSSSSGITALGYQAGYSTTGANCTYVGYFAGQRLTTGTQNTCVGSWAGYGASTFTADNLTAVGFQAGLNVTTGSSNTLVGSNSGVLITSGGSNAAFGYYALGSNTTFSFNTAVGYLALYSNNASSGLVAVGFQAGYTINAANANFTALGYQAGRNATGVDCTYLGYNAGYQLTSGTQNTCMGSQAGYGATTFTAGNLTAVGFKAGFAITTGNFNTLLGSQAGVAITSGTGHVAIGYQALNANTTSLYSVAVGYQALFTNNTSDALTALGYQAGYSTNTTNAYLTALGYQAAYFCTGVECTYVGFQAGQYSMTGARNTCVGFRAGFSTGATHTAGDLTAVGHNAGYAITTGNYNTLIGSQAGVALTTGGANVFIGYQAGSAETTNSNKLYIANSNTATPLIYGDFSTPALTINGSLTTTGIITQNSVAGVVCANAALSTTATDGFLYIPTCAGPPTGVPTSKTGTVPMVYDTTNNNLYIYNGSWKKTTTFT